MLFPDETRPRFELPPAFGGAGGIFNSYLLFLSVSHLLSHTGFVAFRDAPPMSLLWLSLLVPLGMARWLLFRTVPVLVGGAVVAQARQFVLLSASVVRDLRGCLLAAVLLFAIFHRVEESWSGLLMWGFAGRVGFKLYWAYFAIRLVFSVWAVARAPWGQRSHLVFAFWLGNVGLVMRCFKYDIWRSLASSAVGNSPLALDPSNWAAQVAFVVCVGAAVGAEVWVNSADNVLFYKIHRTIHSDAHLYSLLHQLHHKAVSQTTLLDSGTISPLELMWTDVSMPTMVLCAPPCFLVGFEAIAMAWHFAAHGLGGSGDNHHLHHHRNPAVNFGLTQLYDRRFNTLKT